MQQPSMKMIQQMQNRLAKIQQELTETLVEGTAGGGAVRATVTASKEFQGIKIDPGAVDPEDVEMLEDLVLTGVKKAIEEGKALAQSEMGKLTAGMGLPPGMGF